MYETKEVKEKVILVAVSTDSETDIDESLDELEELVNTAGAQVVGRVVQNLEHINKMASETVLMLNWSIEAYIEKDKVKAEDVIAHDDIVDTLFDETKNDIIKLIQDKSEDGEEATDLLMVAKYFERIGDHATNISEWVLYSLKTSADEEF